MTRFQMKYNENFKFMSVNNDEYATKMTGVQTMWTK